METRENFLDVLNHDNGDQFHLATIPDEVMPEIERLGILPIIDLCHFGVPDWRGNFQNPEMPVHLARFAGAFAERYPWVRAYTPVNETYVAARIDWDTQLAEKNNHVNACGLFDMDRKPWPVAHTYRALIQEFASIAALTQGEMFEVTDRDAVPRMAI